MRMLQKGLLFFLAICLLTASGGVSLSEQASRRDRRSIKQRFFDEDGGPLPAPSPLSRYYQEGTLLAAVEDEEHAREIAELYGIELVSAKNGLALFHTELDVMELIHLGRENGWPHVQPNWLYRAF
ncbi:MAG: hypothetical protein FWD25_06955 [Clostridia bacterium]|nr:hypothetical protein [Clostridia bacterium]